MRPLLFLALRGEEPKRRDVGAVVPRGQRRQLKALVLPRLVGRRGALLVRGAALVKQKIPLQAVEEVVAVEGLRADHGDGGGGAGAGWTATGAGDRAGRLNVFAFCNASVASIYGRHAVVDRALCRPRTFRLWLSRSPCPYRSPLSLRAAAASACTTASAAAANACTFALFTSCLTGNGDFVTFCNTSDSSAHFSFMLDFYQLYQFLRVRFWQI